MSDAPVPPEENLPVPAETEAETGEVAARSQGTNEYFRSMMERNFLDYASYVIGSRAIPDVDDGLKPVQRRILWTLYRIYDNGRTTKTANVVGNAMHYHPHGDASIGDALVVLANKGGCVERMEKVKGGKEQLRLITVPYFIAKEGNFGNIVTGTPAAAARYTECSLTRLAHETMFNNDITGFVPNYDGREQEPVLLPAKVPSLLMLGSDGIAVGMSTVILPHNFNELLDAEIAELRGQPFHLYPDFQQGGLMDVREYEDGNGRIVLRARIEIDGRDLVIREIPACCTTASLIASIERAAEKNKIRISNIQDFTSDRVEIRVTPTRGYDPEKTLQGLYMYTDCSSSISPKMTVICDRRPVQMTVTEVLKRNVQKLLGYLKKEFEIEIDRLNELRHAKTLAQLFFENRIYKRIEECASPEEEYNEVFTGLAPFRDQLLRDVTKEDVDKLLALPVRRIARFDIEKNQQELRDIARQLKEVRHHLAHLTEYAIGYLEDLKKRYGGDFPRRTEIERLEQIDRTQAALNNIRIGWDRKNGYIGRAIRSEDTLLCNEFDHFLCVERSGSYKIIGLPPDKMFIGKLYDFRRYDAAQEFGIIYRDNKTGKFYGKRSVIDKFIRDKEYSLCPPHCRLELFTPRSDAVYTLLFSHKRGGDTTEECNLKELPLRASRARGILVGENLEKITHLRYLTEEELAALTPDLPPEEEPETVPVPEVVPVPAPAGSVPEGPAVEPEPEISAPEEETAVEPEPEEVSVTVPESPAEEEPVEEEPEEAAPVEPSPEIPEKVPEEPVVEPAAEVPAENAGEMTDVPAGEKAEEEEAPAEVPVTPEEPEKVTETPVISEEVPAPEPEKKEEPEDKKDKGPKGPSGHGRTGSKPPEDDGFGVVQPELFGF